MLGFDSHLRSMLREIGFEDDWRSWYNQGERGCYYVGIPKSPSNCFPLGIPFVYNLLLGLDAIIVPHFNPVLPPFLQIYCLV